MKCLRLKNRIYLSLPWQVLTVCMPILHRYADYLTRIFIDSVFIQNSYTQCFLRDMVERTKEFDHSKWVGGGMLDYRFSNARRIVNDIYAGEVSADV